MSSLQRRQGDTPWNLWQKRRQGVFLPMLTIVARYQHLDCFCHRLAEARLNTRTPSCFAAARRPRRRPSRSRRSGFPARRRGASSGGTRRREAGAGAGAAAPGRRRRRAALRKRCDIAWSVLYLLGVLVAVVGTCVILSIVGAWRARVCVCVSVCVCVCVCVCCEVSSLH